MPGVDFFDVCVDEIVLCSEQERETASNLSHHDFLLLLIGTKSESVRDSVICQGGFVDGWLLAIIVDKPNSPPNSRKLYILLDAKCIRLLFLTVHFPPAQMLQHTYTKEKKSTKTIVGRLPNEMIEQQQRTAMLGMGNNDTGSVRLNEVVNNESITPELHRLRCVGNSFIRQWDMQPASVSSSSDDRVGTGFTTLSIRMGDKKPEKKTPRGMLKEVVQEDLERWRGTARSKGDDYDATPREDADDVPAQRVLTARSEFSREYTEFEMKQNPTLRRLQLVLRRIQMAEAIYHEIIGKMTRKPRSDTERLEQLLELEQAKAVLFVGRRFNLAERIEAVLEGAFDAQARKLPYMAPSKVEDHLEDLENAESLHTEGDAKAATKRPPPTPELNLLIEEKKEYELEYNFLMNRRDLDHDDFQLPALRQLTNSIQEHLTHLEESVHPDVLERLTRPAWDYTLSESNFKEICWLIESLDLALTIDAFTEDIPAAKPKLPATSLNAVALQVPTEREANMEAEHADGVQPLGIAALTAGRGEDDESGIPGSSNLSINSGTQRTSSRMFTDIDVDQTFLTAPAIFSPSRASMALKSKGQSSLNTTKINENQEEEEPSLVGFSTTIEENPPPSPSTRNRNLRQQRLLGLNLLGFMYEAVPVEAYKHAEALLEEEGVLPMLSTSSSSRESSHKVQAINTTQVRSVTPLDGASSIMPKNMEDSIASSAKSLSEVTVEEEIAAINRDQEIIQVFRLATADKKSRRVLQLRPDLLLSMRKLYQLHNYAAFIEEVKQGGRIVNRRTEEEWIADIEEKLKKKKKDDDEEEEDGMKFTMGKAASNAHKVEKPAPGSVLKTPNSQLDRPEKPATPIPKATVITPEEEEAGPAGPVEEIQTDNGEDILHCETLSCGIQFVVKGKLSQDDAARRMAGLLDAGAPLSYERVTVEVFNPTDSYAQATLQIIQNKLKNLRITQGVNPNDIQPIRKNVAPHSTKTYLVLESTAQKKPPKKKGKKPQLPDISSCEGAFVYTGRLATAGFVPPTEDSDDDATKYRPIPPVLGKDDLFQKGTPDTWGKESTNPLEDAIKNNMNLLSSLQMGTGTGKINPAVAKAVGKKEKGGKGKGKGKKGDGESAAPSAAPEPLRGTRPVVKPPDVDNMTLTEEEKKAARSAGISLEQALEEKKKRALDHYTAQLAADRPSSARLGDPRSSTAQGRAQRYRSSPSGRTGGVQEILPDPSVGSGSPSPFQASSGRAGSANKSVSPSGSPKRELFFTAKDIEALQVRGYKSHGVDTNGRLVVVDNEGRLFVILKDGRMVPAADIGITHENITPMEELDLKALLQQVEEEAKYELLMNPPKRKPVKVPEIWKGGTSPSPTISISSAISRPHSTAEVEKFSNTGGIRFDLDDEEFFQPNRSSSNDVEMVDTAGNDYESETQSSAYQQGMRSKRPGGSAGREGTRSLTEMPSKREAHNFIAEVAKMKKEAKEAAKKKERQTVDADDLSNYYSLSTEQNAIAEAHKNLVSQGAPPVEVQRSQTTGDYKVLLPADAVPNREIGLLAVASAITQQSASPGSSNASIAHSRQSSITNRVSWRGRSARSLRSANTSSTEVTHMGDSISHAASIMKSVATKAAKEGHVPRRGPRGVPTSNPQMHTGSEMEMLEQQARELYLLDPIRYNDVIDDLLKMASTRLTDENVVLSEEGEWREKEQSDVDDDAYHVDRHKDSVSGDSNSMRLRRGSRRDGTGSRHLSWSRRGSSFQGDRGAGFTSDRESVGTIARMKEALRRYSDTAHANVDALKDMDYRLKHLNDLDMGMTGDQSKEMQRRVSEARKADIQMHEGVIGEDFFDAGLYSSELYRTSDAVPNLVPGMLKNSGRGAQANPNRKVSLHNMPTFGSGVENAEVDWNDPANAAHDDEYMRVRAYHPPSPNDPQKGSGRAQYRSDGIPFGGVHNLGQRNSVDKVAQYYREHAGKSPANTISLVTDDSGEGTEGKRSARRSPQTRQFQLTKVDVDKEEKMAAGVEAGETEVERIMFEQMKAKLLLRAVIGQMRSLWAGRQNEHRKDKLLELERKYEEASDAAWELGRHRIINVNKLIHLADRRSGRVVGWIPCYTDDNVFTDQYGTPIYSTVQRRVVRAMHLARNRRLLPMNLLRRDIQERWNQHLLFGYKKRVITLDEVNADMGIIRGRVETYGDMRTPGERMRYRRRLQKAGAFQRSSCLFSPRPRREADLPYTKLPLYMMQANRFAAKQLKIDDADRYDFKEIYRSASSELPNINNAYTNSPPLRL
eukprot:gene8254-5774_t